MVPHTTHQSPAEITQALHTLLATAQAGFPLIPLKPRTKKPIGDAWQARASTDPDQILRWWDRAPTRNAGIVVPLWLGVLDIDPRNNGLTHWDNLLALHDALPRTWHAVSGRQDGGFHLYFTTPVPLPYCTNLAGEAVQLLGAGHLVVAPPSLHPDTGRPYAWEPGLAPWEGVPLAPLPRWLQDLAMHISTAPKTRAQKRKPRTTPAVKQGTQGRLGTLFQDPTSPAVRPSPGAGIVAKACDPTNLPAMLSACGLPPTLTVGETTRCPMHEDAHPSAVLLGPSADHRSYGYYCHATSCNRYHSLTDIYHHKVSGNLLSLHSEEDARGRVLHHTALRLQWTTRLLEAAGIVHHRELGLPSVPTTAPEDVKALWEVFLHVRAIRCATRDSTAPMPFSLRFIQDWTGDTRQWSLRSVNYGKRWLVSRGYLESMGKTGAVMLWRIGSSALRRARKGAEIGTTEQEVVAEVEATEVPPLPPPTAAYPCTDPDHASGRCATCDAQARILATRRQHGIVLDPDNPYAERGCLYEAVSVDEPGGED